MADRCMLGRPRYDRDRPQHGREHGHDTDDCARDTAHGTAWDMVGRGLRHDRACAATWWGQACDTAGLGLRHGAVRLQCVRRLGQGWVHCAFDSVLT